MTRPILPAVVLIAGLSIGLAVAPAGARPPAQLPVPTPPQQPLGQARELYVTAAYEDALAILDRLKAGPSDGAERREIEQYRALCFLALKRQPEAERAIESLVTLDPFYRPLEADAAPWVRASFAEVRKRVLPAAAQQQYLDAKSAFGKRDYAQSAALMERALAMLEDPDLGAIDDRPALVDLRTLAQGFLELSQAALAGAATPAAQGARSESADARPAAPTATPLEPGKPDAAPGVPPPAGEAARPLRIYSVADRDVIQPTVVFQRVPAWPNDLRRFITGSRGRLELVIDESGLVETAVIRQSMNTVYDGLLLAAAKTWRYTPALLQGKPVKYRRLIEIVSPERDPGTAPRG